MVLLIICIFFSRRRNVENILILKEEATFQKALLMSLEVFTGVLSLLHNKEGHRQKESRGR